MQTFFWSKFYHPATASTLPPLAYQSLTEFFDKQLTTFAERDFSVQMGVTLNYQHIKHIAHLVSRWIQGQSFSPNASIAIMLPNLQSYVPLVIGSIASGRAITPINPLYTARELEFQLNDANAEVIFIFENCALTLEKIIANTPIKRIVIIKASDLMDIKSDMTNAAMPSHQEEFITHPLNEKYPLYSLGQVLEAAQTMPYTAPQQSPDDVVVLQYTGGTTGRSKGMMLTHRNILTAIEQYSQWFLPVMNQQEQPLHMILALPLYHIFAFIFAMLSIKSGMMATLVANPRDIDGFIKTLAAKPFHIFPAVNTLYQALVNHPDFKKVDTSQLRLSLSGGMAATPTTAQLWFEYTGCPIIEGWGMSETAGAGICNPPTNREYSGDVGMPLPGIDLKICDDNGNPVPLGQSGEIYIKGDNVTIGYHNMDSSAYFSPDGYLKTGDIGRLDENGHVKLLDRKKDMLIVSGFNVYPTEIEAILLTHPKVQECAVIGIDDDLQGQSIKAYIVKADDSLSVDELKLFSQEQLTAYKRPRHYQFIEQLPKTAVGKILKPQLRSLEQENLK